MFANKYTPDLSHLSLFNNRMLLWVTYLNLRESLRESFSILMNKNPVTFFTVNWNTENLFLLLARRNSTLRLLLLFLVWMFVQPKPRSVSAGVESCQRCYHIVNFYHSWGPERSHRAVRLYCDANAALMLSSDVDPVDGCWDMGAFFHFYSQLLNPSFSSCFQVYQIDLVAWLCVWQWKLAAAISVIHFAQHK